VPRDGDGSGYGSGRQRLLAHAGAEHPPRLVVHRHRRQPRPIRQGRRRVHRTGQHRERGPEALVLLERLERLLVQQLALRGEKERETEDPDDSVQHPKLLATSTCCYPPSRSTQSLVVVCSTPRTPRRSKTVAALQGRQEDHATIPPERVL
jgi:hypothetical protein